MNTKLLPALPIAVAGAVSLVLRKAQAAFWRAYERRQQRLVLASLDERQLRDLGLTREAAMGEADKPFWR